ncbi:MAG: IS4 family transposase [Anaerolineales bacterium]|nr:IS4 family transposase [Anaerolineales bacterium]
MCQQKTYRKNPIKTITRVSKTLQTLFGAQADRIAKETGFIQRAVKVTGSKFAETLVFGFLNKPKMSYRQMSQSGALSGLQITAQGLEQKFGEGSAKFMQTMLEQAVSQLIKTSLDKDEELLNRFQRIHIQDGSVIGLPDQCVKIWQGVRPKNKKGCSAVKLHVSLEYKSGQVSGPVLANGREHDQKSPFFHQTLKPGELRITDLGFFSLDQLEKDAQAGGFWVIRYKNDVILYQNDQELPLASFLKKQHNHLVDIPVQVGQTRYLPCRLIAIQVDEQTAAERIRKLRAEAKKNKKPLSAERLQLAHWTIVLTNAPQNLLSPIEVYTLLRLRWQIELLFRLWKTYSQVDESESKNPWRILTEMYAKLIAVLIQQWILLASVWHIPNKSIVLAASLIQSFAIIIHLFLKDKNALCLILSMLVKLLQSTPALLKRKKQPSTAQILCNPQLSLR